MNSKHHDDLWYKNGEKLLCVMKDSSDMLVCAEDLGVVPPSVPKVLSELNILGLKVERWTKKYEMEGEPYIEPGDYPRLSVCTTSVHDSTTLRGLWEEDNWDREQYFSLLQMSEISPDYLTTEVCREILVRLLKSNSMICIFPLQDLFALYYNLRTENPDEERINFPGTISEKNWSYRMKNSVDFLLEYREYNNYLRSLIGQRKRRTFQYGA